MPHTKTESPRQGYLSINEFAGLVGVHPQTVRTWDKNGLFAPHHRTPGGQRRYTLDQVQEVLNSPPGCPKEDRRDSDG